MQDEIRERLRSTAAAAALHIDGDLLDAIDSAEDVDDPVYKFIVRRLDELRTLPNIRFVYILRTTNDPMMLSFVADADGALTDQQLDRNGNGHVDSFEEPGYPGELYDISDIPALQGEAFDTPTVDKNVTIDQWGLLVSGYAPIRRFSTGEVVAVLGVDMEAADFFRVSQRIFSPVALILVLFTAIAAAALVVMFSKQRQIEILKRINGERSGLLRLTFHQLGEPLTIMKWSLESLRDETSSPQLQKLVTDHIVCMDEGLGRLNSIIDTLQLAEKIDLNTLEYLPVESSLLDLVNNTIGEWESSLQKRGQHIDVSVDPNLRMPLDRTMIGLVLRQILINAIEYSDDHTTIAIRAQGHKRHVHVTVEDHGCGIPRAEMQNLFEKYRRASNAHLKKPDGNGLGLYIVKGIIEKAGGSIWVESIEGRGTNVNFTLPLA